MSAVRWHRNARGHLEEVPVRLRRRMLRATRPLARFPRLGVAIDADPPGQRRLVVAGWSVVYTYDEVNDVVSILALVTPGRLLQ
ncbi:MAG: type II toxin-antitoxin system RelE/ParE family toxin [Candidatus Dormibacteraeota bacterium]|nr:type II toxin-antitoxin system RelE/ParE family toxin [Candidatus Dormibacteraeota bacterium]